MIRSQCRIAASFGGGVATALATIRLSPEPARDSRLMTALIDRLSRLATLPGLTGAHLLVTDTPKTSTPTAEQKIRGGDAVADWIVLLSGYDADVVSRVVGDELSASALREAGASAAITGGTYRLGYTMSSQDAVAS
jgi:hypothetical protein